MTIAVAAQASDIESGRVTILPQRRSRDPSAQPGWGVWIQSFNAGGFAGVRLPAAGVH